MNTEHHLYDYQAVSKSMTPKMGSRIVTIKCTKKNERKLLKAFLIGHLRQLFYDLFHGSIILFLWATLLIISAVAFGALDLHKEKRLPPVLHGISVLVLIYGVLVLVGAASGHDDLFNPLHPIVVSESKTPLATRPPSALFQYASTAAQLQAKLETAKAAHKPVMLEFFASWCPDCKEVDRNVLSDATIRMHMRKLTAIRIDVSERNQNLAELMEQYKVFGVPTMIFYDRNGNQFVAEAMQKGITKEGLLKTLQQLSS